MDATDHDDKYFVFDNRLASFQGPQPVARRRPSHAGGARAPKALSWPHRSPAPVDLARAGFFYSPQPSNPDNVRCFLCHKDLDGWEEDDDPLQEHLKHSSTCGWAICAAIELELGDVASEDPRLPYLLEARRSTFADLWPYEAKKGWKCKTKQLADAGWKYTPTLESDDNTTCVYCQLALDGWESSDKPMEEHQRRSPHCPFFTLISRNPPPKKTAARGRAARSSKASRLSTQSTATVDIDAQSAADPDESVMTTATVVTQGGRKAATTRGRKPAAAATTTRGRKPRAKKEEPVAVPDPEPESEPEPEFEPELELEQGGEQEMEQEDQKKGQDTEQEHEPVAEPAPTVRPASTRAPAKPGRGRKRASAEMESSHEKEAQAEAAPPPKKRVTRVRASDNPAQAESSDYAMFNPVPPEVDEAVIDAELRALELDMEVDQQLQLQLQQEEKKQKQEQEQKHLNQHEEELQVPKKGRKTGTRKVSKQTHKTREPAAASGEPQAPAVESELAPEPALQEPEPKPEPDKMQAEPEPEPAALVEPKTKAKPKPRAKPKASQQAQQARQAQQTQQAQPPARRRSREDFDMDEPDELHEDSFVSIVSSDSAVRAAVDITGRAPLAPAPAPVKRGRGRPSKKSTESARSSAGLGGRIETHVPVPTIPTMSTVAAAAPSKVTPIPPPAIPGFTAPVAAPPPVKKRSSLGKSETKAPAAKRSQTNKALPPLPMASMASMASMEPAQHESRLAPGPAPTTPRKHLSPVGSARPAQAVFATRTVQTAQIAQSPQATKQAKPATLSPSPSQSPQSSDAENQPPSSRPTTASAKGKRIGLGTAGGGGGGVVALGSKAVSTPVRTGSPMKRHNATLGGLRSGLAWSAVDVEAVFELGAGDVENGPGDEILERLMRPGAELSMAEKAMTVEEFIYHNAGEAERLLRAGCEAMVSVFEQQGSRAMRVLESLEVVE